MEKGTGKMKLTFRNPFRRNQWIILLALILAGAVLGRLAVRSVLNILVGGTMFGGNFL